MMQPVEQLVLDEILNTSVDLLANDATDSGLHLLQFGSNVLDENTGIEELLLFFLVNIILQRGSIMSGLLNDSRSFFGRSIRGLHAIRTSCKFVLREQLLLRLLKLGHRQIATANTAREQRTRMSQFPDILEF